jgi:hypothetical protein
MAADSDDVNKWLNRMLLLLPGFLAMGLARYIGGMASLDEFELTLYSLSVSLVIFLLSLVLYRGLSYAWGFIRKDIGRGRAVNYGSIGFGFFVLSVAVVIGSIIGRSYRSDLILKAARTIFGADLKLSSQRPLSLLLSQNSSGRLEEGRPKKLRERESWLEVAVEGGERFAGYPLRFRTTSNQSEIFLSPACRLTRGVEAVEGPGVLVSEKNLKYIIFSGRAGKCYNLWKELERSSTDSALTNHPAPPITAPRAPAPR